LYSESISDVEITKVCGLLDLLEHEDSVMADKGFTTGRILEEYKVKLIISSIIPNSNIWTIFKQSRLQNRKYMP